MITLSTFQEHLASKEPLPQDGYRYLEGPQQQQQLLQWTASLPAQTERVQARQLESILTELTLPNLDDKLCLELMSIVGSATDRLITSLRKHYIYEIGALNHEQISYFEQVKSLYYHTVLVYDGVVEREGQALDVQHFSQMDGSWRRLLPTTKTPPLPLAQAVYASLMTYQKLLFETAFLSQEPPKHIWSQMNKLFGQSHHYDIAYTDLSDKVVTRNAKSIHQLYKQMCLHSLLNVRAMRRSSILLIQRLLPIWAEYIETSIGPKTNTRVFVDLNSDSAPNYLTASSAIDPFDGQHACLFLDLEPLANYLSLRIADLRDSDNDATEYRLITNVLLTLNYRYIERKTTMPSKYSPKQRATIITGFNNIHSHVAKQRDLLDVIGRQDLPSKYLPRTAAKANNPTNISVETFDSTDVMSQFRLLQLSKQIASNKDERYSLQIMSLFLLCRPKIDTKLKWSIGVVRWLIRDEVMTEVEWQVLGHQVSPCGVRSANSTSKNLGFVSGFIVADDDDLQTGHSLLLPAYHFHEQDRVVVRVNDEQQSVRLLRCLLSTEEFSQYEFVML